MDNKENIIIEASLGQDIDSKLKKSGIAYSTDSISEINDKNVIINTKSINDNDKTFIENLAKLCSTITDYNKKIINIPVDGWFEKNKNLDTADTPLGAIYRYIKQNPSGLRTNFAGFTFIFYNNHGEFFPLYVDDYKASEFNTFINLINVLTTSHAIHNLTGIGNTKSPVKDIQNDEEKDEEEIEAEEIVDGVVENIEAIASDNEDEFEAMYNDDYIASIITDLENDDTDEPKINGARASRLSKLNSDFLNKNVSGKNVKDIINSDNSNIEIPTSEMKVSSINEEWGNVKFTNFEEAYDVNDDIIKILADFTNKEYPISIIDFDIKDTSTNQDYIDTYTVKMEDYRGKRFSLVFDVPKFKNNRFMRLRGNDKVMSGQLSLLPCIKTDEDTVQCVSNYNKIFIKKFGKSSKSYPYCDKFLKAISKCTDKNIKVQYGDNTTICSKYNLPVDYIGMASEINKIETDNYVYYFNQDVYYSELGARKKHGYIPYSLNKNTGEINYFSPKTCIISRMISNEICAASEEFNDLYSSTKVATTLNYSIASLANQKIPLVIVLGCSIGLTGIFKALGIDIKTTKPSSEESDDYGKIEFKDGNIYYPITYENSMLLNGLSISACDTESYNISDIDKKTMWIDFLCNNPKFGGRDVVPKLYNFVELFMDPITREVCEHCKIPTNYIDLLIYSNKLLSDNGYNKHTDISGNRYRTNEIIAGYVYKELASAYAIYKANIRMGRDLGMSIKRTAVIDAVMADSTCSDLSILNPLLEIESANAVSFKGLSGMNSDRSYTLDKRTYDDSMINKVALSTGFAANVGITRQSTIDMDVETTRGYIKDSKVDDMSITKSFSVSEAVTPFGTSRDDPFRSAMTFIQTAKHSMRTNKSMPLLITNGADEAMPYMASDTFAFKAKEDGTVIEKTDNYMIIEYKKPVKHADGEYTKEYIDLEDTVKKNSDGGFFINMKLKTDLNVGKKFKKSEIIAYDPTSFSRNIGEDDNLSYNLGVLAKVAILNTDEGFEDSTSVSEWMSEAMATDVVVEKEIDLDKKTNVYNMVQVGQEVQEGDPLLVFQNTFDEKDANMLLKNITDPEFVSDLGRISIKSKYTGHIQDIKIYRTCNIDDEMSDSLKSIITSYEKKIKNKKKIYKDNGIPGANLLDPDYVMQPTGKMKNNTDGVKIVFYIAYNDKLSVGDKIVAQSANKGVVKGIFPKGKAPFTEFRPNEEIHALFAARSFNARMVTSVWSSGAINKCMIELDRHVKEIMGLDWEKLEDME